MEALIQIKSKPTRLKRITRGNTVEILLPHDEEQDGTVIHSVHMSSKGKVRHRKSSPQRDIHEVAKEELHRVPDIVSDHMQAEDVVQEKEWKDPLTAP